MVALGTEDTPLDARSLVEVRLAFAASLAGKSPRTAQGYGTGLDRFFEFLVERGLDPALARPQELPRDALEQFYVYLVRRYGRTSRATHATYLAGVRAFFRFLERHELQPAGVTMERIKAGLREVMGRVPAYKTPRIDQRIPEVVTYVESVPLPTGGGAAQRRRLELLRDRALIRTLYCTAMRRAEVVSLNRADVQDGHADQALITGKGDKE